MIVSYSVVGIVFFTTERSFMQIELLLADRGFAAMVWVDRTGKKVRLTQVIEHIQDHAVLLVELRSRSHDSVSLIDFLKAVEGDVWFEPSWSDGPCNLSVAGDSYHLRGRPDITAGLVRKIQAFVQ